MSFADPARAGSPLRGVLWDLDGTLLDSEPVWDQALREFVDRLGGTWTAELERELLGASSEGTLAAIGNACGHDPEGVEMRAGHLWLQERVAGIVAGGGVDLRPGAAEALRTVRRSGLTAALVTNSERALVEVALDLIGRDHFDVVICGDEVTEGKPSPRPYLDATIKLGLDPAECVAVEDSATGAAAAAGAGCGLVLVPDPSASLPSTITAVVRTSLVGLTVSDLEDALNVTAGREC